MTEGNPQLFYEFSGFNLDLQQRLLRRSNDRSPIPLSPRAFDTLLCLVERHGELIEKTALLRTVWPNVVVEENSLNQNISAIRRALGEAPGEHRFIVTEPGRGYRFVAPVRTGFLPTDAPTAASENAVASKTPTSGRKSVAVLPFVNLTGDPAKEYFSDGMAEELIHILARVPGLTVPSRTSAFSYKGRNADLREIARELDVGVVLEGSVRSAGERIRVTAQLIDGATGFHLWSENYDRQFGDVFELQDELARAIMSALRLALDATTTAQILPEPPTRDIDAYHLYLRAMAMQATDTTGSSLPGALHLLEQAIARDPGFARARNGIASIRAIALAVDVALPGTLAEAEREILDHLAPDATPGPTNAALGVIYAAQGKWLLAQRQFHAAIAGDDSDPTTYQSYGLHLLGSVGLLRGYADAALRAFRLAPGWVVGPLNLTVACTLLDDSVAAGQYSALCMGLGVPETIPPLSDVRSQLALRAGRFAQARDLMEASLPAEMRDAAGTELIRKLVAAFESGIGAPAATTALDAFRARWPAAGWPQFMKRRFIIWYTTLGALDQSFEVMTEVLDRFGRSGTIGTAWAFLWMREMLPFRQDPRFQALCRRMGMFEFWQLNGPPDRCELNACTLICR